MLDDAAERVDSDLKDQPVQRAKLQGALAATFHSLGLNEQAIELGEQVRAFYVAEFGIEHEDTLQARHEFATYLFSAGRVDEAIAIEEQVYPQRLAMLGDEHRDTMKSKARLAACYFETGRFTDSLKMQEEILEVCRKTLDADDGFRLDAMNTLARSYFNAGRHAEATKLRQEQYDTSKQMHGTEHPLSLLAAVGLSNSYAKAGRFDDAIELLETALSISQRVFGEAHPLTAEATSILGVEYYARGDTNKGLRMLETAANVSRETAGAEHPATLDSMKVLAGHYRLAGRFDEAIEIWEHLVPLGFQGRGRYKTNYLSLALPTYIEARRVNELEPWIEKWLESDPDHTELNAMSWKSVNQAAPDGTFRHAASALNWAQRAYQLAPSQQERGAYANTIGVWLYRNRQWQEAIEALQESIAYGFDEPHNWLFIAMSYWQLNKKYAAAVWYDTALSWKKVHAEELESDDNFLPEFYVEAANLMDNPIGLQDNDGSLDAGRNLNEESVKDRVAVVEEASSDDSGTNTSAASNERSSDEHKSVEVLLSAQAYSEATALLQRQLAALELEPDSNKLELAAVQFQLGWASLGLSNFAEAESYLSKSYRELTDEKLKALSDDEINALRNIIQDGLTDIIRLYRSNEKLEQADRLQAELERRMKAWNLERTAPSGSD